MFENSARKTIRGVRRIALYILYCGNRRIKKEEHRMSYLGNTDVELLQATTRVRLRKPVLYYYIILLRIHRVRIQDIRVLTTTHKTL